MGSTPNEIAYGFTPIQALDLANSFADRNSFVVLVGAPDSSIEASERVIEVRNPAKISAKTSNSSIETKPFAKKNLILKQRRLIVKTKVFNAIAFAQMNAKYYYNNKH